MNCASSRTKLICLPLQGRRANYPSDIQILQTGSLHLMESDPWTVHSPSKKKRRMTCLAGTNVFRCLEPHENTALEEKLLYRNGSASGNEQGTYQRSGEFPTLASSYPQLFPHLHLPTLQSQALGTKGCVAEVMA